VQASDGTRLILDAGTGIRRLGATLGPETRRVDLLLTHLHMDHIQGLGFFEPLVRPNLEVNIWGPSSTTLDLRTHLARYLSPPLFPVRLRDLPCDLTLHDVVPGGRFEVGSLAIDNALVCHPGPTVGYRVTGDGASITYLPDHEPALGARNFPGDPDWISGFALAAGSDLLIHDAQYSEDEYAEHVGWGHSAISHALEFAALAKVQRLVLFHHDPGHSDDVLDGLFEEARNSGRLPFELIPAVEGAALRVGKVR
jgi:phosphoribosyl 1,2-cyclic phosphodiesterase